MRLTMVDWGVLQTVSLTSSDSPTVLLAGLIHDDGGLRVYDLLRGWRGTKHTIALGHGITSKARSDGLSPVRIHRPSVAGLH